MIGLCMGCGALFSMHYGAGRQKEMKECIVGFFLACSVGDAPHVPDRVYRNERDSDSASDTGRHL